MILRALSLVLLSVLVTSAAPRPVVDLEVTELGPGLAVLRGGPDGNVLVVSGSDGVLLVDGQSAHQVEPVQAALASLGAGPVAVVVNTHYHEDHVGLNATLAAEGALVIAHERARAEMASDCFVEELDFNHAALPDQALPQLTFAERLVLHWGDREVRLRHLPAAHTGGDTVVQLPGANLIHTGDLVEDGAYPFLDIWHGGSIAGLLDAVETLLSLSDDETRFIPGHGPILDRARVVAYRDMLATLRGRVARAVEQGRSVEQLIEADPAADLGWGSPRGGRRLAALIYLDLSGER